jgi:ketosteroid isomerase-like protein/catechol 2,3-dioxygenase-like lactoylglutathione lyase family enzyme
VKRALAGAALWPVILIVCPIASAQTNEQLAQDLRMTEAAFAKTMADRDLAAFVSYLAEDTIFFTRDGPRRGSRSVAEEWKRWYQDKTAPFSWAPEQAVVLESGNLGLTSGSVYDPSGRKIGMFNSIWRRGTDGKWKIVFDKGCEVCETERTASAQDEHPAAASAVAEQAPSEGLMTPSLVGVYVPDLERAKAWYQRSLGFSPVEDKSFPELGIRISFLRLGSFELELVENKKVLARSVLGRGKEVEGIAKLAFNVSHLGPLHERLRKAGATIVDGPSKSNRTGQLQMMVRDDSGNLLQFFERP